jgi:hypothetical protein
MVRRSALRPTELRRLKKRNGAAGVIAGAAMDGDHG